MQAEERPRSATLRTVQAARGIACVSVAAYHVSSMFALPRYGNMTVWSGFGEVGRHGVDLFFVISGFIIFNAHRTHVGQPRFWSHYAYRRFARVYPVYWIYTTAFLLLAGIGLNTSAVKTSVIDLLSAYSLVRLSPDKPPLWVAWTLFHEVLFYAVFSLLLINRRLGAAAMTCWLGLIAVAHATRGAGDPTFLTVIYDMYNLQFAMGMVVAASYRRLSPPQGVLAVATGLAVLGFSAAVELVVADPMPRLLILSYGIGSAAVLLGLTSLEVRQELDVPRVLQALGDATFTIYLAHGMLISLMWRVLAKRVDGSVAVAGWACVAGTVGVVAVCYGLYLVLERPLLRLLMRRAPDKPLAATQRPLQVPG